MEKWVVGVVLIERKGSVFCVCVVGSIANFECFNLYSQIVFLWLCVLCCVQ